MRVSGLEFRNEELVNRKSWNQTNCDIQSASGKSFLQARNNQDVYYNEINKCSSV